MSNPYVSVTVSGYNSSPPSDDGSQTDANSVKWATHKDKLTDPLNTAIASINTNVSAAFALTFGATVNAKTDNYTVTVADRGKFLTMNAATAKTITLLAAATAGDSFPLAGINIGTAPLTLDADGSETINGVTSVVVAPGGSFILTCDASLWAAVITSPPSQVKVKTADETVNNSTTIQDDDHLTGFTLEAGAYYPFEGVFIAENTTTAGLKLNLTFTDVPQIVFMRAVESFDGSGTDESATSLNVTDGQVALAGGSATASFVQVTGILQANASTGGTMKLQWAQNVATVQDTKLRKGTYLRLRERIL